MIRHSVRTIRLASRDGEVLAGSFMITPTTTGSVVMNMQSNGSTTIRGVVLKMPTDFKMPTTEANAVWIYFVLPAPLTLTKGFGVYTYNVDIDDPEASSATYTHAFVTPTSANGQIQIKQNHITTVAFGDTDAKGNNGNINGAGWQH